MSCQMEIILRTLLILQIGQLILHQEQELQDGVQLLLMQREQSRMEKRPPNRRQHERQQQQVAFKKEHRQCSSYLLAPLRVLKL